ncbi:type VI immunity family protein [Archangium primigenium]|uniref:type VI immunity family protein n=1 Tax=[Archangium] primigenium TaxID=2792470 RepID=UPI003083EEAB
MSTSLPPLRVRADNGLLVARDGLILCFFMRHTHDEVASAVWTTLRTYRAAIPPHTLSAYVTPEGGLLPLDDERWEHTREELLARPSTSSLSLQLQQHSTEMGGYHFEYVGRRLEAPPFNRDENATCAVSFTLPTEYLREHGPARVRDLALAIGQDLPFSFGYASLALVTPHLDWYAARRAVRELRDRYLGLDVAHLEQTSRVLGTRARGAYWLTFLGERLLDQLGGCAHLNQRLAPSGVTLHALDDHRAWLSLGEWPEAIDTARGESPSPRLLALARALEPFLYEQEVTGWFFHDDEEGLEDMRRWIRRFCSRTGREA